MKPLRQGVHHADKGLNLLRGDALTLHIDVEKLIKAQQIAMIAVEIDIAVHVVSKHLRRRPALPLKTAVVVLDVLIPHPDADVHDQRFFGAVIGIHRRHGQPRRLCDVRHVYRVDGSRGKDMKGCLYNLLLRPCLAQRVHLRIDTHTPLRAFRKIRPL